MSQLIDRFITTQAKLYSLIRQVCLQGLPNAQDIAEQIIKSGELVSFLKDETFIKQDDTDQFVYFLLAGEVGLVVNGSTLPYGRKEGETVGELSAVQHIHKRLASVTALDDIVAIQMSYYDFNIILGTHPLMFKNLFVDSAKRLQQRNTLIRASNPKPVLFLISSVESIPIIDELLLELRYSDIDVVPWNAKSTFTAGSFTLDGLDIQLSKADFALAIAAPEDVMTKRKATGVAPRDNVLFELGFFMGTLSRERAFLALEKDKPIILPTDLNGLTPLTYTWDKDAGKDPDIKHLAIELKRIIAKVKSRRHMEKAS